MGGGTGTGGKPKYYCTICGADMYGYPHCTHNHTQAPAFCNGRQYEACHEGGPGTAEHGPCPGYAGEEPTKKHPAGSCPCSCHIRVSDEELAEAREKLERMLEAW